MAKQNAEEGVAGQTADIVNQQDVACVKSPDTSELRQVTENCDSVIESENKSRRGIRRAFVFAAALALMLTVGGFAYANGGAVLKDDSDQQQTVGDWIMLSVTNATTAAGQGYVAGSSCITTVKLLNNQSTSRAEDAYVRVHIAVPAAVNDFDDDRCDDILDVSFEGCDDTSMWSRLTNYRTKVNNIDYNVAVFVYKGALASGSTTEELRQLGIINASCDVDVNGATTIYVKDGTSFTCEGSIPVLLCSEAVQADAWNSTAVDDEAKAVDVLNTAFGPVGDNYRANWTNVTA